jgi:hypothetical protein
MPKTCRRAVIVPPQFEIDLGISQKQCDIRVGSTYTLAPHCDLWMRGAKTARVKRIYCNEAGEPTHVSVAPIVNFIEQRGTHHIPLTHFE